MENMISNIEYNQNGVSALMNCNNTAGFRIAFRDAETAGYLKDCKTIGEMAFGYARFMADSLSKLTGSENPSYSELLKSWQYEQDCAKREEGKTKNARDQASAQVNSINEMVRAMELDQDRLEELREERKPWAAGWNMSGYLPDSEPGLFADFEDAAEYIADQLEDAAEGIECEDAIGEEADYLKVKAASLRELAKAFRDSEEQEISQQAANGFTYWINRAPYDGLTPEDFEELQELESLADEYGDEDEVRHRIEEDPLSVQIRSGWVTPGEEFEPEEFEILLCNGDLAVRIVGDLDEWKQPCRARVEYQDWFTPWTEYFGDNLDHDAILSYCRVFYFGE